MDNPTKRPVDLGELVTDMRLGVANVLIALHRADRVDLRSLLPELEALTELTTYGEDKKTSSFSRSLAADLRGALAPRWQR